MKDVEIEVTRVVGDLVLGLCLAWVNRRLTLALSIG